MNKTIYPLLLVICFGCSQNEKELISPVSIEPTSTEVMEQNYSPVILPKIPASIEFAGTEVPFEDLDMRERLDKELVINSHWHSNMIFYIKRSARWFPIMREILKHEGVPEDFLYLAVIESGLTQATSPSGAKGFWQFLEGTAKDYGLKVNRTVDERLHVEKSTRAACQYLKKAYNKFGSWFMTAAAYNRGSSGIESDRAYQYMEDYFDLHLNQETSRYVFRILAVKLIMESPQDYGFVIPETSKYPPYKTKSVEVSESIADLAQWAVSQGVNYKILKILNPWLIARNLEVGTGQSFSILLPASEEQLGVVGSL